MLDPNVTAQQHDVQDISPEEQRSFDIDGSINQCVYYVYLHRMVPFDEPEVPIQCPNDNILKIDDIKAYKACSVSLTKLDYKALHPQFAWLPADIIQKTFRGTMQYVHKPYSTVLRHHYKAPNPALNHFKREEPVTMD